MAATIAQMRDRGRPQHEVELALLTQLSAYVPAHDPTGEALHELTRATIQGIYAMPDISPARWQVIAQMGCEDADIAWPPRA